MLHCINTSMFFKQADSFLLIHFITIIIIIIVIII